MPNQHTMSFISSAVFWGIIIVLIGLSIILREVFHINFPFIRVIFGLLLIYWGIKVIVGGFYRNHHHHSAVFSEAKMDARGKGGEYNIVFGNGTIDLFKMETPDRNQKVEVNVVFGSGTLILNDSIPARIEMNTVFGRVRSPERGSGGFGTSSYQTSAYKENEPYVKIEANAVFGNLEIENRRW